MEIDDIYSYNHIIIDIRDKSSYNNNHIDNSVNIPLYNLITNIDTYLDKNKNYLLVCEYGIQSKLLMNMLNRLGYHTNSLKDGFNGYIRKNRRFR